eukprot:6899643-Prymnesium_polylepis.1
MHSAGARGGRPTAAARLSHCGAARVANGRRVQLRLGRGALGRLAQARRWPAVAAVDPAR